MHVDERMEAMFVSYLYHPMEVRTDYVGAFPEPTTYQEAEDPVLREELRNTEWEVSDHYLWMTNTPLSLLRDENIRDELANRQFSSETLQFPLNRSYLMGHYVPRPQPSFCPLDAPSSGIHVQEHRTYYVHTYGASDYIPSGILSTYDRVYFFL